MNLKFNDEIRDNEIKTNYKQFLAMNINDIEKLEQAMSKLFSFLKEKATNLKFNNQTENDYYISLLHFYLSITSK